MPLLTRSASFGALLWIFSGYNDHRFTCRAWRLGTVGVAIGISGMPGLVDLRGTPDLFDYRLRITTVGAADELAAAASLVMGQAAEGTPVVHARGFPYPLRPGSLSELIRPKEQDMFR